MVLPIESEDVAAGDGALQTFSTPGWSNITKSSERFPSISHVCALTPEPPWTRSSFCMSGMSFCSAFVNAVFDHDLYISPKPSLQYFFMIL